MSKPQRLLILQSMWAMERRHPDGYERPFEESLDMIGEAGFDGINLSFADPELARVRAREARRRGLEIELMCYPTNPGMLEAALRFAEAEDCHHVNAQPDVRLRRLEDGVTLIEGFLEVMKTSPLLATIETHRNRLTTDMFFTLDLMERCPDMRMNADLSHCLVGREPAVPIAEEFHADIRTILDRTWAFHGRVASREQTQIEISFSHHKYWLDLFVGWWAYGFKSWRSRAPAGADLTFTCELGPQPYAITGPDGTENTDRWKESLMLKDIAHDLWRQTEAA